MAAMSVMVSTWCVGNVGDLMVEDEMKSLRSSFGEAKQSHYFRQQHPELRGPQERCLIFHERIYL